MPPDPRLELSCPAAGHFYVCADSKIKFVGCCMVDPCADGSGHCPPKALFPSSFSADARDLIPPQACAPPEAVQLKPRFPRWYACAGTWYPFLGCCTQDACGEPGCPAGDLAAAMLSDNATEAAPFLEAPLPSPSTTTREPPISPVPITTTSTISGATSGAALPSLPAQPGGKRDYTDIGLGIGITAALLLAAAFAFLCYRRRAGIKKKKKKKKQQQEQHLQRNSQQTQGGAIEMATLDPNQQQQQQTSSTPDFGSNRYTNLHMAYSPAPPEPDDRPLVPPRAVSRTPMPPTSPPRPHRSPSAATLHTEHRNNIENLTGWSTRPAGHI